MYRLIALRNICVGKMFKGPNSRLAYLHLRFDKHYDQSDFKKSKEAKFPCFCHYYCNPVFSNFATLSKTMSVSCPERIDNRTNNVFFAQIKILLGLPTTHLQHQTQITVCGPNQWTLEQKRVEHQTARIRP